MKQNRAAGFTVVELLVAFAVIAIVTGLLLSGFRNYARYQEYNQAVSTVRAVLYDARMQARGSEGGVARGVKVLPTSLVVYPGTSYSAGNSANQNTILSNVTLSTNFTGGVTELSFSNLTGLPSATGTIMIVGTNHTATTTIEITAGGGIQ